MFDVFFEWIDLMVEPAKCEICGEFILGCSCTEFD
jgi:hypothetical protein